MLDAGPRSRAPDGPEEPCCAGLRPGEGGRVRWGDGQGKGAGAWCSR
jgi:hypothetical protein